MIIFFIHKEIYAVEVGCKVKYEEGLPNTVYKENTKMFSHIGKNPNFLTVYIKEIGRVVQCLCRICSSHFKGNLVQVETLLRTPTPTRI